jgi:hypothetical protein
MDMATRLLRHGAGAVACFAGLLAACGPQSAGGTNDDGAAQLRAAGAACSESSQCQSGHCIVSAGASVCAERCVGDSCVAPLVCHRSDGRDLASDGICVSPGANLCHVCVNDHDCLTPGDICVQLSDGMYCGQDCSEGGRCPTGYTCTSLHEPAGAEYARQCLPQNMSCGCTSASAGSHRPCEHTVPGIGTCRGEERCDAQRGWVDCDAPQPLLEVCNGKDDDCDQLVDEGPDGQPLERECGYGPLPRPSECRGVEVCRGVGGYGTCSLAQPADAESECDGRDENCDGSTDGGVLNTAGHCGACGVECPPGPEYDATTQRRCVLGTSGYSCGRPVCIFPYFAMFDPIELYGCDTPEDTVVVNGHTTLNNTWQTARHLGTFTDANVSLPPLCDRYLLRDDPANHEPPLNPMAADFYSYYLEDTSFANIDTTVSVYFDWVPTAFNLWICGSYRVADLTTDPGILDCTTFRIQDYWGQSVSQRVSLGTGMGNDTGYYYFLITYTSDETYVYPFPFSVQVTDDLAPSIGTVDDPCSY